MSTLFDEVASPEGPGNDRKESRFGDADRKRLIILGAVGGLAIVAAGGYFLLGSGSSSDSGAAGPVVTHHVTPKKPAASAAATPKASTSPTSVPTVQSALATGRDPFAPLIVAPAANSSPAASSTSTTGTSGGTGTSGSSTTGGTTGTTTGGSSATASASPSAPVADGKFTLTKLDYDTNNVWFADITFNGKSYQPTIGSTFAGTFTFVAESNGYASFKNGNQAFSLSVGESKQF